MAKASRPAKPRENILPEPRELDVIVPEYEQTEKRLGNAKYLEWCYKQEADNLIQQMLRLNQESAARKQLNAAKAAKEQENGPAQS